MQYQNGALSGTGLDFLLQSAADAQFVILGEQHLSKEIPLFTTALFDVLHAQLGFNYLAIEEGPVIARTLSALPTRGDVTATVEYVRRFPNAIHLLSEHEVEMFANVSAISDAATDPLWGVNQAYGALHILDSLSRLASSVEAQEAVDALLDEARAFESERFRQNIHYLIDGIDATALGRLRDLFLSEAGATDLVETLLLSHDIFSPYAAEATPEVGAFFESGEAREANMKRLFAARYREAQGAADSVPKVLVKSGNVHAQRGLSPGTKLYTFGNFLYEVAQWNGRHAFLVSAHIINDSSAYAVPADSWFRPVADVTIPGSWTVLDTRRLQPWLRRGRLEHIPSRLRELLLGFDALVLIEGGSQSGIETYRTPNFRWFPGGS